MLYAVHMCVHGDKMDLLFHLYEEKHEGGGLQNIRISVCRRENAVSLLC